MGGLDYRQLRQQVYDLMLYIHHISPETAEHYISKMDTEELERRLEMYRRVLTDPDT